MLSPEPEPVRDAPALEDELTFRPTSPLLEIDTIEVVPESTFDTDVVTPPRPARRGEFLRFCPPSIGEEEIQEVADSLRSGWITTGPKAKRFEAEFMARVNAPAALALSSCTAGLHTSLVALGIGPGDEVITTPLTFCSTVNVIEHVGATPVLVDVEADTLNISAAGIEAAITNRTRAILVVHYAGHPVDLDPIREIALQHGIPLIEDAAHAITAKYKGRSIGSGDNLAAFSFYATKNLTTGEGGMLTGSPDLIERSRRISMHGMNRDAWKRYSKSGSWYYEVTEPGFKYNMTDIQAGLGLAQLAKVDRFQNRRREAVADYNLAFFDEPGLETPVEHPWVEHAWHLYVLRLRPEALRVSREQFIEELTERNIGSSVHFIPVHLHPYYRDKYGYRPEQFPVALRNYERMVSLPLHPGLTAEDTCDVIYAVLDIVSRYRR
jgi:dTDP-4-amino-4,6-dideoxygalactose transaminase